MEVTGEVARGDEDKERLAASRRREAAEAVGPAAGLQLPSPHPNTD
jgi:hypothetical protein